jgi:N-acetyl-gamma-glutamyl-phosphate reductase
MTAYRVSLIIAFLASASTTWAFSSLRLSTSTSSSSTLFGKPKVFIDGEAGTTGIQVYDRLSARDDLEIISAPFELRKDEATRKKLINEADAVILCKFMDPKYM